MGNGDLPPPRPDQSYNPPRGGQAVAGQRSTLRARQVIIFGTGPGAGIFVYSPAPGPGNLIASITAEGATVDPYGNTVLAGVTEYLKITPTFFTAVRIDRGQITFYDAAAQPGPWTALYTINAAPAFGISEVGGSNTIGMATPGSGGPALIVNGASQLSGSVALTGNALATALEITAGALQNGLDIDGAFTVDGFGDLTYKGLIQAIASAAANLVIASQVSGDTNERFSLAANGTMTWGTGAAAGDTILNLDVSGHGLDLAINHNNLNALAIANALANGGQTLVQLTTAAGTSATDRAVGIQASGDTAQRMRLDTLPAIRFGPGNAGTDCAITRGGPDQIACDYIAYSNNGGTPEVWQAVTFQNGWVNDVTLPNLQYRRVAAPYNSIQWVGRTVAPAGIVAGQAVSTAPSSIYRPTNAQTIIGWDHTTNVPVQFQVLTNGSLHYQSGAAAGDIIEIPSGNGLVSLDA